ncbi:ABC transporter permease [Clostridium ganghwense]|uniref:ABC transporter permease n=1 Tax=Clostridium ganghwense TaxID=312089 RepID=A0ABT4CNT0_9CLOT|nr:ABC transporter permease [Clostridium ganghwense]MCY6370608.1 ABC transporter permease [Clostridium ganghwense]
MISIFKNELLKLKRSRFLEIIMIIPLLFVGIGISNFIRYKSIFLKENPSIWEPVYEQSALLYGFFLLPVLVTVIMCMIVNIENKNNNIGRMLSIPIKRKDFYIGKFLCGCFLIFINILVFILIVSICGNILKPSNSPMPLYVIYRPILTYFALVPVMAIQYYLSIKFSNIFIPIALGILFTLLSFIVAGAIPFLWIIFPWSYAGKAISATHVSISLSITILMYFVGIVTAVVITYKGINELNSKDIF